MGGEGGKVKENCILTTTAVAAGGLSAGFISAFPALSWFGFTYSTFALFLWVFCAAFFGMFFAIPLRRYALILVRTLLPFLTHQLATIHSDAHSS